MILGFVRVYPFLDWNQGPVAAAYYLVIAVALFLVYFGLMFIHRYRNMLLISHSAKVNGGHEWESQESDQSRNGNSTEEALAEESV